MKLTTNLEGNVMLYRQSLATLPFLASPAAGASSLRIVTFFGVGVVAPIRNKQWDYDGGMNRLKEDTAPASGRSEGKTTQPVSG